MKLNQKYIEYKNNNGEQPLLPIDVKIAKEDGKIIATMTKEVVDRDGEIVSVSGIRIPERGVPLLDSHKMWDNVTDNVLGRIINITKVTSGIHPSMTGEIEFAPTPKGQIAKALVEGGYVDSVSIGFSVIDYNNQTRTILESELYECSLVSVPANPMALINIQKSVEKTPISEIEKTLNHYKKIKPVWDQVRKTFLLDDFFKKYNVEKTGELLFDLDNIYNVLFKEVKELKEETPQAPTKEQPSVLEEELHKAVQKAVLQAFNNQLI